jgi:hypothetical protein
MSFGQQLILESIGPLTSAIVGTLIIGWFVTRITQKAQDRRADNQLHEELVRAQHQLRLQLIGEMTDAASRLYMATQSFWRKKDVEGVAVEQLGPFRVALDRQYQASRVQGEVLERRLEAYFESDGPSSVNPRLLWHATMDLLTVRYFQLIGLDTDALRTANAGPEHSGLSASELLQPKLVLETYRRKLRESARAVLQCDLRESPTAKRGGAKPAHADRR